MPSAPESSMTQISETRVDAEDEAHLHAVRVQADEEREVDHGGAGRDEPQPETGLEASARPRAAREPDASLLAARARWLRRLLAALLGRLWLVRHAAMLRPRRWPCGRRAARAAAGAAAAAWRSRRGRSGRDARVTGRRGRVCGSSSRCTSERPVGSRVVLYLGGRMGGADGDTIARIEREKGLSALKTTHFPGSFGSAGNGAFRASREAMLPAHATPVESCAQG